MAIKEKRKLINNHVILSFAIPFALLFFLIMLINFTVQEYPLRNAVIVSTIIGLVICIPFILLRFLYFKFFSKSDRKCKICGKKIGLILWIIKGLKCKSCFKRYKLLKVFLVYIVFFFIIYPIIIAILSLAALFLHLILGGNGSWGSSVFKLAGLAWKNWKISLLVLFIWSLFSKPKKNELQFFKTKIEVNTKSEKKKNSSKLFVRKIEKGPKTSLNGLDMESSDKEKEIEEFFDSLEDEDIKPVLEFFEGVVLDDANYNLFYSIINKTEEQLSILTWRVDEKLLCEMLWPIRNKLIKVTIITKNRLSKGYLDKFKDYCDNLDLEIVHRKKIHAKFIISDSKVLAIGSSNITNSSMSKTGCYIDTNFVTTHKSTVKDSLNLFKSIYECKDYMQRIDDSKLEYSKTGRNGLPLSLKEYFENEKEEVILFFSCDMVDKIIIDRVIEWNPHVDIKLYVGDTWNTSGLPSEKILSMKWLYDASINNYKKIKVIPIHSSVHAKVYLFKSQNVSFISSQNLTVSSWQSLLEAGIIHKNKEGFKDLRDSIRLLQKSYLNEIEMENLYECEKPEDTFSGSNSERSIDLPWGLAEEDPDWKIPRTKNQVYYRLSKKRKTKEKSQFSKDSLIETKFVKDDVLDELKKEYISKRSGSGLRARFTRGKRTGKVSKKSQRKEKLSHIDNLKARRRVAKTEEEKKKCTEGINHLTEELEKLE